VDFPPEYTWAEFLEHQGWTDQTVLDRQPDLHVERCWLIYQARVRHGLLNTGMW
jgi:hypothetical protein